MIKLKHLLKENPDTVYVGGTRYVYTTEANRCAFFVYVDNISKKTEMFGYSANAKKFFGDPDLIDLINNILDGKDFNKNLIDPNKKYAEEELSDAFEDLKQTLNELKNGNRGGGHLQLERIVKITGRLHQSGDVKLPSRIFLTDDKKVIVTFWSYNRSEITPYRSFYEKAIEINGYDPKECIYEPGSKFYTYDEFYTNKVLNLKPGDIAYLKSDKDKPIKDRFIVKVIYVNNPENTKEEDIRVRVEVLNSGSQKYYYVGDTYGFYINTFEKMSQSEVDQFFQKERTLDSIIDDKTQEFVEKRGKLHSAGAALTPQEKNNLEVEVDRLDLEIKKLKMFMDNGVTYLDADKKSELEKYVSDEMARKHGEKKDSYSLIKQAEKQYGMPIAQLRQKFRGVPLDQLIKKESLYKKLINRHWL